MQRTRSNSNENAAKSTKLDIRSLITVWLQVRVLPGHHAHPSGYAWRSRAGPTQLERRVSEDGLAPKPSLLVTTLTGRFADPPTRHMHEKVIDL
jgi:hypothetical protein